MVSSIRASCPACTRSRWLSISTDGNGGTVDEWQRCENPDCNSNSKPNNEDIRAPRPEAGHCERPEELMAQHRYVPTEKREMIKRFIRGLRQTDPNCKRSVVLEEVNRRFNVTIAKDNFIATYWTQAKPNGSDHTAHVSNGRLQELPIHEPEEREEVRSAPERTHEPVLADEEEGPVEESAALYQIIPMVGGRTRVILDVEVDAHVGHALMSVIGLTMQQQKSAAA